MTAIALGLIGLGTPASVANFLDAEIGGPIDPTQLPDPTTTTLGGVKAAAAAAGRYQTGIDTSGNPTFNIPSYRGTFTLPANVTSYTVNAGVSANAANCTTNSDVILIPQTPNAALQAAFAFAVAGTAQFVVTCAPNSNADAIFNYRLFV